MHRCVLTGETCRRLHESAGRGTSRSLTSGYHDTSSRACPRDARSGQSRKIPLLLCCALPRAGSHWFTKPPPRRGVRPGPPGTGATGRDPGGRYLATVSPNGPHGVDDVPAGNSVGGSSGIPRSKSELPRSHFGSMMPVGVSLVAMTDMTNGPGSNEDAAPNGEDPSGRLAAYTRGHERPSIYWRWRRCGSWWFPQVTSAASIMRAPWPSSFHVGVSAINWDRHGHPQHTRSTPSSLLASSSCRIAEVIYHQSGLSLVSGWSGRCSSVGTSLGFYWPHRSCC